MNGILILAIYSFRHCYFTNVAYQCIMKEGTTVWSIFVLNFYFLFLLAIYISNNQKFLKKKENEIISLNVSDTNILVAIKNHIPQSKL